jgi:multiple sugar transport system ATP-binding protein
MRRDIAALRRRLGTTTIYVTHDQVEAMTLGDRIVVMRDGRVQQLDTPLALYRRPANTFVATFLGTPPMNLVRGMRAPDGPPAFQAEQPGFRLPLGTIALPVGQRVILGIRPEDLRLGGASGSGVSARVQEIEPLGNETLVSLDASGVPLTARIDGAATLERGATVTVSVAPEALHWFDGERETRLPS